MLKKSRKFLIASVAMVSLVTVIVGFRSHTNRQNRVRWEGYLEEITEENWNENDFNWGTADLFLDMDWLIEFLNSNPTRTDILDMDISLQERTDTYTLSREGHFGRREGFSVDVDGMAVIGSSWALPRHSLRFHFQNIPDSEELTYLYIGYIRYFDSIDFEALSEFDLTDQAGILSVKYYVNVRVHSGGIMFEFEGF